MSNQIKFNSDIDIDFADRKAILKLVKHTSAGIVRDNKLVPHNTGVYVTDIPVDPFLGVASLDHKVAEERGYMKLDFLNVGLYEKVRNEEHLTHLMTTEPLWDIFNDNQDLWAQLIHVNNHWNVLKKMPEAVDSIPRLAMFLAIIRPAKRHLIGLPWTEVAKTIWEKTEDGYQFKKSHAVAYAHLVVVNMNLICEGISQEYS
jgi:hypothetical protein